MKRFFPILITFLLLGVSQADAQTKPLSKSAWASLVTCEPSNELYTSFSHSALHICDTAYGINLVYNYGTFDFNTPHFVWKFATRTLDYCLSRESYRSFIADYTNQRRCVWEQRLNLSHQEVCNLFILLEFNYQPEYRWYRYDFFRDNCATRIRDMICNCLDHDSLDYPKSNHTGTSYREIVYTTTDQNRLWWRLAIDMALGARCDRDRSTWECAFLPLVMKGQFDTITRSNGIDLIADPAVKILEDRREPLKSSVNPTLCFWALFIVIMILGMIAKRKGWKLKGLDCLLFAIPGLLSLLVIFLWFLSAHWCCKWNFNILWTSPLWIFLSVAAVSDNMWRRMEAIAILQIIMLVILLIMIIMGWPQKFNAAILPITLILIVRLVINLRKTKNRNSI